MPTGATSARSTPIGRPISTSPTSCRQLDLYDRDWPIWTYAEITPPAKFVHDLEGRRGIGGLLAGRRATASSRASAIRRSLLFTGVRVNSYSDARGGGRPAATANIGPERRLKKVVVDRGVHIPEGLVVGEDPELDAKRFRRTDKRRVPDHPADDRPAICMTDEVLSVASEVFPLVKTGGLADVVGALPAALSRMASRCDAGAGLSGGHGGS